MAIIEDGHPVLSDKNVAWADLIKHSEIIIFELDKAILALTREGLKEFRLTTGQTTHNVTPLDLPVLIQRRKDLIDQIARMEDLIAKKHAPPPALVQVVPKC